MSALAAPAEFYDDAYSDPDSDALLPWALSPLKPVWSEAATWIHAAAHVVDLGCGTGQFAQCLLERKRSGPYLGIDYSRVAIERARAIAGDNQAYELADLRSDLERIVETVYRGAIFVCLETLEHLDDDVALVEQIPPGRRLIFSVPNYDSEAHVRTFPTVSSVWERYAPLVHFRRWTGCAINAKGGLVHVCDTTRRADSWGALEDQPVEVPLR